MDGTCGFSFSGNTALKMGWLMSSSTGSRSGKTRFISS